jgi:hypothetical protein
MWKARVFMLFLIVVLTALVFALSPNRKKGVNLKKPNGNEKHLTQHKNIIRNKEKSMNPEKPNGHEKYLAKHKIIIINKQNCKIIDVSHILFENDSLILFRKYIYFLPKHLKLNLERVAPKFRVTAKHWRRRGIEALPPVICTTV